MKLTVEFKFSPKDVVVDVSGKLKFVGVVTHCSRDALGDNTYSVRSTGEDRWWNEEDLKLEGEE